MHLPGMCILSHLLQIVKFHASIKMKESTFASALTFCLNKKEAINNDSLYK